jgi:hypothetical protein
MADLGRLSVSILRGFSAFFDRVHRLASIFILNENRSRNFLMQRFLRTLKAHRKYRQKDIDKRIPTRNESLPCVLINKIKRKVTGCDLFDEENSLFWAESFPPPFAFLFCETFNGGCNVGQTEWNRVFSGKVLRKWNFWVRGFYAESVFDCAAFRPFSIFRNQGRMSAVSMVVEGPDVFDEMPADFASTFEDGASGGISPVCRAEL